ncbi:hypothetical protein CEXT_172271 [Caerostris extrusa]|uniref:NADH dehydrogenase subunit 6 n=1 Tax=Caerostris extrusa TaxID=172846 RepID=A0AAV4MNH5_CAEEX|nr:hypothetical protein CEXT_172271 [Caerostris extrusa]
MAISASLFWPSGLLCLFILVIWPLVCLWPSSLLCLFILVIFPLVCLYFGHQASFYSGYMAISVSLFWPSSLLCLFILVIWPLLCLYFGYQTASVSLFWSLLHWVLLWAEVSVEPTGIQSIAKKKEGCLAFHAD